MVDSVIFQHGAGLTVNKSGIPSTYQPVALVGFVYPTTLLSAVTANGAGTATLGTRAATYQAFGVTSSGAGSATVTVEGSNDGTHWVPLGTISLTFNASGTTDGDNGFAVATAPWYWVRGKVASLTGTGAAVTLIRGA
jgi:hypothetical protein